MRGKKKVGLLPGEAVAIIAHNSPEYVIMYLAAIAAGGVAAGVYTSTSAEVLEDLVVRSRATVLVGACAVVLKKAAAVREIVGAVKSIIDIGWHPEPEADYPATLADPDTRPVTWKSLIKLGMTIPDYELGWRLSPQNPAGCCSFVFTSGTTGSPKVVMLSHDNLVWTAKSVFADIGLTDADVVLSYLPLAHISALLVDVFCVAAPTACPPSSVVSLVCRLLSPPNRYPPPAQNVKRPWSCGLAHATLPLALPVTVTVTAPVDRWVCRRLLSSAPPCTLPRPAQISCSGQSERCSRPALLVSRGFGPGWLTPSSCGNQPAGSGVR